jgi:dihydrofolate reductase
MGLGKIRVENFTISLDGFGAGPDQDLANPMGVGGGLLHGWARATRTFRTMFGQEGGADGVDEAFAQRGFRNIGAWVLGRNMFGPVRGPWPDEAWRGWWGDEPPYHVPVFVLTHHARPPLEMAGDNVFHFVTGGLSEAINRARAAAGARDVRIGGGVQTIRACLAEGLLDEMHLAISPVLLGKGEHLTHGLDLPGLGYSVTEHVCGEAATHVVVSKGADATGS